MPDKPPKALYIGYTSGTDNHGDEALIWIIRELLAPEIEVVTSAQDFDIALLGGGTLINQSPWLIDHFKSKLERAGRGAVFGTGVGDTFFWGNEFGRWRELLEQCDMVGVRGPVSRNLLQVHGFASAEDIGDPYLWLNAPATRPPVLRHLGVNIGSTNNSLWGTTDEGLCDTVGLALKELEARGWTFSLLSVWEKDLPLLEKLRGGLRNPSACPVYNARTQTLETFSVLAKCQVFLGEKLHANAMAAVAGTPFIAMEYQPKVRDFAASLEMAAYCLSTAEATPQLLVQLVEEVAASRAEISCRLSDAKARRRNAIIDFANRLKAAVTKPGGQSA